MLVLDLSPEFINIPATSKDLCDRAVGAYLGLAVGDALGATVEFMTPNEIRERYGQHRNLIGGGWLNLRKGKVTDDTEMSLALGRSILAVGAVEACAIAEAFSGWMRGKPIDIGHTVRRGISQYRLTGRCEMPESEHDAGNGACMRCLPIALFTLGAEVERVAAANRIQSHVTHHNPLADAGTLTVIRLVQAALMGAPKRELRRLADALAQDQPLYRFDRGRMENPSGYLVDTLRAVLQALFATNDFDSALIDVVNRGGDADTTGAILGMIVGALYGRDAIPRRLLGPLEKATVEACEEQAIALVSASPRGQACRQRSRG
ncbi:ADP-ribosyl-[dinitrogen reductase] hydrolase [Thiocapsa imhoffii]|uniref:ADP-ribosyl-[dinitrogen reductase] hydrolase n=1 Tax=Thiocapsa imhoffii TaxID=382777 RepID=A0A9X0WJ99_9GAMM|nr:ADP-ribosyl-[dinitrogen reductase] hydrolase [Thiocapsa imhoffii]MBK1645520.1 ADP-ribosyl-[dinitrogen reductase] hydrolase [Thiocapsa imhoffii]